MSLLRDVILTDVASEAVGLLEERLEATADALAIEVSRLEFMLRAGDTPIGRAAITVARYAKSGRVFPGRRRPIADAEIRRCMAEISAAFPAPAGQIALVLDAANCRLELERGESVPSRTLAALGSISPKSIRSMCSRGNGPASRHGVVQHADAVEWLAGRGVVIEPR